MIEISDKFSRHQRSSKSKIVLTFENGETMGFDTKEEYLKWKQDQKNMNQDKNDPIKPSYNPNNYGRG